MTIDALSMERSRDLQTELGAMLDRFHVAGLSPQSILEVLACESELWNMRFARDGQKSAQIKIAHEREQA